MSKLEGTESFGLVKKKKENLTEGQAKIIMVKKVKEVFGKGCIVIDEGDIEYDESCDVYKLPVHIVQVR